MQQGCHQSSRLHLLNPKNFTINDDSNDPTIPYGFGRQLPIVPPSLNDLNLPPNPFNVLAIMAIANNNEGTNDDNYSLQSPEPSAPSPISTPPMNVSPFNSWETCLCLKKYITHELSIGLLSFQNMYGSFTGLCMLPEAFNIIFWFEYKTLDHVTHKLHQRNCDRREFRIPHQMTSDH